ncbi:hypothetical protein QAD02_003008 [Eretmocerus hayati]|uniref:Uncharacterized protein n=1 Tax=Eretmocerus hayati TaxID=131215 RepID=A0ACC2NN62_9HYME|nr:hypothetical protein QAD02_003008 [Eretmocerus hayati]
MPRYHFSLVRKTNNSEWSEVDEDVIKCLGGFAPANGQLYSKKGLPAPATPEKYVLAHRVRKKRLFPQPEKDMDVEKFGATTDPVEKIAGPFRATRRVGVTNGHERVTLTFAHNLRGMFIEQRSEKKVSDDDTSLI